MSRIGSSAASRAMSRPLVRFRSPIAFLAAGHAADTVGARPVMAGCAMVMLAAGAAPLLLGEFRRLRLDQPAALEPM